MANKIIVLLPATLVTIAGGSKLLAAEDTRNAAYQATVSGTGAVSASVVIEVSNDNVGWLSDSSSTLSLSGTTVASAGLVATSTWAYVRARVTAISGTGASVTVTASVGA
jgi:hypothetical protein